ncbi:MAG: iron chaperone [Saprospiraceae bacterium]
MTPTTATTIDEYIATFPEDIQAILQQIRATIKAAAPHAEETISYAMPTFKQNGVLAHFAAFKNHIGFYATPTAHDSFAKELSQYKTGKGSVQFPLDQPMPLDLIRQMVEFKLLENAEKAQAKKK